MQLKLTSDEVIELRQGEDINSALKSAGVYLVASCGGKGLCGKCKVRLLEGEAEIRSQAKLTEQERQSGVVLACQTFPLGDVLVDIPKESRLVVGDKIAVARTKDLAAYLASYGVAINPVTKRLSLELPPPTISDNISDLERLKRALDERGLSGMRFSYGFVSTMSKILRDAGWHVDLTYVKSHDGPDEAIFLSSPQTCTRRFGIAVDIGTTTVVVYLVDLITGEVVDTGSTYNSQMRYGDDVITRIVQATEGGELQTLREAVVTDITTIVESLRERRGMHQCEIEMVAVAGNTTMAHIFWGLDPGSIREEPYIPTLNYFPGWKAGTAQLSVNPQAPVYTVPCIASYVGGDIVAGVLASKMHRNEEIALFMDIGTNGEIAIGNNEWLMAAACSAGPCFEGSGIRCGMRATAGAVEAVKIDPATFEPSLTVVGGGRPLGICGSGMIDTVSEMFLTGLTDRNGKLIGSLSSRVRQGDEGIEYLLYRDERLHRDVVLTEVDIENLLRAKAAVYAGITTLLKEAGFIMDDIQRVYIAGGFGNYLNIERAIILGMLPDIAKDRYVFLGNSSVTGTYLCLLSEELRRDAERIASQMTYIELSVSRSFMDEYMSALFLPHTDIEKFPSVASLMMSRMMPKKSWPFNS